MAETWKIRLESDKEDGSPPHVVELWGEGGKPTEGIIVELTRSMGWDLFPYEDSEQSGPGPVCLDDLDYGHLIVFLDRKDRELYGDYGVWVEESLGSVRFLSCDKGEYMTAPGDKPVVSLGVDESMCEEQPSQLGNLRDGEVFLLDNGDFFVKSPTRDTVTNWIWAISLEKEESSVWLSPDLEVRLAVLPTEEED